MDLTKIKEIAIKAVTEEEIEFTEVIIPNHSEISSECRFAYVSFKCQTAPDFILYGSENTYWRLESKDHKFVTDVWSTPIEAIKQYKTSKYFTEYINQ